MAPDKGATHHPRFTRRKGSHGEILDGQGVCREIFRGRQPTELAAYPGEAHGFFNYGRVGNKMFIATMQRTDVFFKQLGWLRGKPTIEQFTAGLSRAGDGQSEG